ncbi:MAG: hypothetical protein ABW199_01100 [Caulobacterales bacterium]
MRTRIFIGIKLAALAVASFALLSACNREQDEAPQDETATQDVGALERAQSAEQLAALGGPASAAQRLLYEGEFQASGALGDVAAGEGAWELQLLDSYAQFVRPGLGEDGGVPGERTYYERGMRVVAGPLTITIKHEACALPNGVNLEYSAHVLFDGVAYQGCAQSGLTAGSRASWASVISDLLPAIDACLARVTEPPARVTIASIMDEGVVSVRMRQANGRRDECLAATNGARIDAFEPVADMDRRNGEGDPEFVRAPGPPPSTQPCRSVDAVDGTNGARLGWLIRRTC